MNRASIGLTTLAAGCALTLLCQSLADGQEIKGQLKIGLHKVQLDQGKLYEITLQGPPNGNLYCELTEGRLIRVYGNNPIADKMYFLPAKTADHTFIVTSTFFGIGRPDKETLDYSLRFFSKELAENPLLSAADALTEKDAAYKQENKLHKPYKVQMSAGKVYIVDLVAKGVRDPYLYLENSNGQVMVSDDDSGGGLNARLVFAPLQDGEYTIIATTLGRETGGFTLTVRGTK